MYILVNIHMRSNNFTGSDIICDCTASYMYIQTDDEAVADIIDKVTPTIIERYLNTLSTKEAVRM